MERSSRQVHLPLVLAMFVSPIVPALALNPPLAENITGTTCETDADCWGGHHWCIGGDCYIPQNRYVSFVPNNSGPQVAFRIVNVDCPDQVGWIGDPVEAVPGEFVSRVTDAPVFRFWDEPVIHLGDRGVVPDKSYEIAATEDGTNLTAALVLGTVPTPSATDRPWGDIAGPFIGPIWPAPDGRVSDEDILPTIRGAYGNLFGITIPRIDLGPSTPDYCIDGLDVQLVNDAYGYGPYPYDEVCVCSEDVDCDDGFFCNGTERCIFGLCYSSESPCTRSVCDDLANSCVPCISDSECSDGRYCNGVELCVAGRCVPGEPPCRSNVCLEESNSCDIGPTIAWVPIDPVGVPAEDGFVLSLASGGRQVSLELRVYGWGMAQGNPVLGVFQTALDSSALSNGYGTPITPVGWPDNPELGVLDTPQLVCSASGASCDSQNPCPPGEGECELNPHWALYSDSLIDYSIPDYRFSLSGYRFAVAVADVGDYVHAATLIIEVPADAAGTYKVGFKNEGCTRTYLLDTAFNPIEIAGLLPTYIIVPNDCNENGIDDTAEVSPPNGVDCNLNRVPDDCDVTAGTSPDCNGNGVPDECEIDCTGTGQPDSCDIADGTSADCNDNGLADECDIAAGVLMDEDMNGIPDICEIPKNRYVTFSPGGGVDPVAMRIDLTASDLFPGDVGSLGWVGAPDSHGVSLVVDSAVYRSDWPTAVHVGDCEIIPAATYGLSATLDGISFDQPVVITTTPRPIPKQWADVVGSFGGSAWSVPNGVVNFDDVLAAIHRFQEQPTAAPTVWVDIVPEVPNYVVNFNDVLFIIKAFEGEAYPHARPSLCP